jgi:zinc protease
MQSARRLGVICVVCAICSFSVSSALPLYRDSLPNGLVVLTYEDHRLPAANLAVVCRSGAAFDPAGKAGLADVTAQVLIRGTMSMTGDSVSSIVEYLGARLYATTSYDYSSIKLQTLAKDLELGLNLLVAAVLAPGLDPKEFGRERDQALEQARMRLDFPMSLTDQEFNRLLFPGHPYGHADGGDTASLPSLKREDLVEFHKLHYLPNNCFVIGIGDLTRADFVAQVKSRFGGWQPGPSPKLEVASLREPDRLKVKVITRPEMNQTYIEFGHLGIAMPDSDMLATRLAAHILGGSALASRLGLVVREQGGLAYDVRCSFDRRNLTGGFHATVQTAKPKIAIEKMFREIQAMHDSGARQAELDDAHNYFSGSFPLTYSSNQGKLDRVLELEVYGFGLDWLEEYPNRVKAVKLDAVNAAARRHLHPGNYLMVVYGNAKKEDLGLADAEWIE